MTYDNYILCYFLNLRKTLKKHIVDVTEVNLLALGIKGVKNSSGRFLVPC